MSQTLTHHKAPDQNKAATVMSFPFQIRAPATQLDTGRDLVYPCKYFMNGLPCRFAHCSFSHDLGLMDRWKSGPGRKQCRNGTACRHRLKGVCLYAHASFQWESPVVDWVALRAKAMENDLDFLEDMVLVRPYSVIPVTISGSTYLASFNKLSPTTISVPGHPPLFRPLTRSITIARPRAPEYPTYTYPFAPLVHSIGLTSPSYKLGTADIVTTSTNLRKLFFLLANHRCLSNRFDIEVRGQTVLMSSWSTDPSYEHASGCYAWAFKAATCEFPEHLLQDGNSVSHHRVEGYELAGVKCVVQTVVDGYICDENCTGHKDAELSVHKMDQTGSDLQIHHSGGMASEKCLVHIEVQNMHHVGPVSPEAQMYFSRRTKLYRAIRYGAVFRASCTGVIDLTDRLSDWEKENVVVLRKLVELLKLVRQRTVMWKSNAPGVKKFSLVCESDGTGEMGSCAVKLYTRRDKIDLLPYHTDNVVKWDLRAVGESLSSVSEVK